MTLENFLLRMLLRNPPKEERKFELPLKKYNAKIIGFESEILLKKDTSDIQQKVKIENIPLLKSGIIYLLVDDVSRKYDITPEKIRRLCREGKFICEKKPNGFWLINEDSVRAYLELE